MTHSPRRHTFLVLAAFVLLPGCSSNAPPRPGLPSSSTPVVYVSGCLNTNRSADFPDSDCVVWEYDGAGTLLLKHVGAPFNCCPDSILATVEVDSDTIRVVEDEILSDPCRCLCPFELHIRIDDLPARTYEIRILEKYMEQDGGAPHGPLIFEVDLNHALSGSYCRDRDSGLWSD